MIRRDRTALVCDFAETYQILDLRRLPAMLAASLAVGLREDSRIKLTLAGAKAPTDIMLLAAAVDRLSLIWWAQTKDAVNGRNRPRMLLDVIAGPEEKPVTAFASGKDFEMKRKQLLLRMERRKSNGD